MYTYNYYNYIYKYKYKFCNDAPWKDIVPRSITNGSVPGISIVRKLAETTNAPEKSWTSPIGISLAETPAPQYPHRVGKTNNERNREAPENLEHTNFTV